MIMTQVNPPVTLLDQGRVVRKSVNANPGLKVNRSMYISCIEQFSLLMFCVV